MINKEKTYNIINESNKSSTSARLFDTFILTLILLNVIAIILESFNSIKVEYDSQLRKFEYFSVGIFTIEYLLRVYTAKIKHPELTPFKAILKFITSPLALIDLFAVLPTYLPLIFAIDLRFIRILRLLRITRLFKLNRYSKSLKLIADVFIEKRTDLGITIFVTFILLIFASTLMYYLEGEAQPEAFPNIIASFWWAVATLTTVGYGDVYPITGWGKFISGIIAVLGIGLVALPTGILSAAFIERIGKKDESEKRCPTCGQVKKEANTM